MNRERRFPSGIRRLLWWTAVAVLCLNAILLLYAQAGPDAAWLGILVCWIALVAAVRTAAGMKEAGVASFVIATAAGLLLAGWSRPAVYPTRSLGQVLLGALVPYLIGFFLVVVIELLFRAAHWIYSRVRPGQSDSSDHLKRGRFQFRLSTLLLILIVLTPLFAWLGDYLQARARRQQQLAVVARVAAECEGAAVPCASYRNNVSCLVFSSLPKADGLRHLKELPTLYTLQFTGTRLSDAALVHLETLTSLVYLGLRDTQVSDAGLVHLETLVNLSNLDLAGTQVSDAGLVHLETLTNLWYVDLTNTQVTPEGVNKLQEALPQCEIVY